MYGGDGGGAVLLIQIHTIVADELFRDNIIT